MKILKIVFNTLWCNGDSLWHDRLYTRWIIFKVLYMMAFFSDISQGCQKRSSSSLGYVMKHVQAALGLHSVELIRFPTLIVSAWEEFYFAWCTPIFSALFTAHLERSLDTYASVMWSVTPKEVCLSCSRSTAVTRSSRPLRTLLSILRSMKFSNPVEKQQLNSSSDLTPWIALIARASLMLIRCIYCMLLSRFAVFGPVPE